MKFLFTYFTKLSKNIGLLCLHIFPFSWYCSYSRELWKKKMSIYFLHIPSIPRSDLKKNPNYFNFILFFGDPQSQARVFIYITWYRAGPAWTHALEGPHFCLKVFGKKGRVIELRFRVKQIASINIFWVYSMKYMPRNSLTEGQQFWNILPLFIFWRHLTLKNDGWIKIEQYDSR